MDDISIDDFAKLDIRIGKIVEATEVADSDKLIRCVVDFGDLGEKIIFSGIKKWYSAADLVGKLLPYIVNLKPRKMPGNEFSQGMLVASAPDMDGEESCALLIVDKDVLPGTKVI